MLTTVWTQWTWSFQCPLPLSSQLLTPATRDWIVEHQRALRCHIGSRAAGHVSENIHRRRTRSPPSIRRTCRHLVAPPLAQSPHFPAPRSETSQSPLRCQATSDITRAPEVALCSEIATRLFQVSCKWGANFSVFDLVEKTFNATKNYV